MRCFVAMCVFREGASEVGPDMPAAQKRREELWKASPAGPMFLALLWLTRTPGSLRFWQSNSHGKRFTTAAYRGDTVHSKAGPYFCDERYANQVGFLSSASNRAH